MDPNTGVTTTVSNEEWGTPWFDGSRLILTDYNPESGDQDITRVVVRRTSDKAVLMDLVSDGYIGQAVPSPLGNNQIKAAWGETIFAPRAVVVWDLATQKVLYATEQSDLTPSVSWMPDGSLLRVRASGAISKIIIGGEEQLLATVTWPGGEFHKMFTSARMAPRHWFSLPSCAIQARSIQSICG
jgi:hypothetical protein